MLSFNDKISIRQLQILLILDIFGTGVIILPRRVAEYAHQDGWIIVVFATILAMVYTYIITSVGRLFPGLSFYQYCTKLLTKPVAFILSVGLIVKIVIGISMEIRFFAEIVRQTLLFKTPFFIIFMCIICISGLAASKGYETRARIAEILIYVIFVPLGIVFVIAAFDVDFTNLLPVLTAPQEKLIIGSIFAGISFKGIEFLLMVYPYMQRPKHVRKAAVSAIGLVGFFMVIVTIITISKFGPFGVEKQMWPVLEIMDTINFPSAFIERQDALIMSVWIISIFSVVNAGLFFSATLLKDIIKKGQHTYYIWVIIPISFLIAYIPKNIESVYNIMDIMFLSFGLVYMLALPLLLLLVAKIRGLGVRYDD